MALHFLSNWVYLICNLICLCIKHSVYTKHQINHLWVVSGRTIETKYPFNDFYNQDICYLWTGCFLNCTDLPFSLHLFIYFFDQNN